MGAPGTAVIAGGSLGGLSAALALSRVAIASTVLGRTAGRTQRGVATPISEYIPRHVVRGRVALVGDAAHAQTPMTGAGFEEAVLDAAALADALREPTGVLQGLQHYELMRLDAMRQRVEDGQSFSRSLMG